MAKFPDYASMDLDELNAHAGRFRERQIELGALIHGELPANERLRLEIERGTIRAHLNIIQPLRTERLIHEQALRNPEHIRLAGMSDEEFDAHVARLRELRQTIAVNPGPEGVAITPGDVTQ